MSPTVALRALLAIPVLAALLALVPSRPAEAGPGIVWLTIDVESEDERVHLLAPLEWLASIDRGDLKGDLQVEGIDLDAEELWRTYKDLPAGSRTEVKRGTSKDGPYVVFVSSEAPAPKPAEGKLHILSREADGKVSDVRFPLDLPALITELLSFLTIDVSSHDGKHAGVSVPGREELTRLGSYGPFTLLEAWEPGNQVRISIE